MTITHLPNYPLIHYHIVPLPHCPIPCILFPPSIVYLRSMKRKIGWFFSLLSVLAVLSFCQRPGGETTDVLADRSHLPMEERYLNWHDTVDYVGIATCRSCHADIYDTYHHTGMGLSFDHATREKSAANFGPHQLVYDSASNFYYYPFWRNDTLMIQEYRIDGTDTIHQRTEPISYIIGSGHHTNSHLVNYNGYVYQAPITFYTQDGVWDMAPGFADGFNSRFSRLINMECMTCHNAYPSHVAGSVNKFAQVPTGIDCERCHGPGELHVAVKRAGGIVDTSKHPDFTIINPGDLPVNLQMNLCQRCHLQGVAVLNEGKAWDDFKPGMELSSVMQVFLPRYAGQDADKQFLMASHVERLKESQCFQAGELSCVTCHNPHVSIRVSEINHFNEACINCHTTQVKDSCTQEYSLRMTTNGNNCSSCHMPKSGSIDIPHVAITDHNIRIPKDRSLTVNQERQLSDATLTFLGLVCMTQEKADPLTMARGYLRFFEGFATKTAYLDSAAYYLQLSASLPLASRLTPTVHYHYLSFTEQDMEAIRQLAGGVVPSSVADANTAFRIGDAFFMAGNWESAYSWLTRATALQPLQLDFLQKLGSVQIYRGQFEAARDIFEQVLAEQPKHVPALGNLGILLINLGEADKGVQLLWQAVALDPDYELAYFNLADYYGRRYRKDEAKAVLQRLLRHQPGNIRAKQLLQAVK